MSSRTLGIALCVGGLLGSAATAADAQLFPLSAASEPEVTAPVVRARTAPTIAGLDGFGPRTSATRTVTLPEPGSLASLLDPSAVFPVLGLDPGLESVQGLPSKVSPRDGGAVYLTSANGGRESVPQLRPKDCPECRTPNNPRNGYQP